MHDRLMGHLSNAWTAQAVYVAARLGIPDLLASGPRSSAELAATTSCHEPSFARFLRALCAIEICRQRPDQTYELAPLGKLLLEGAPGSLRNWAMWWGETLWAEWGQLLYSVQTGRSARTHLRGVAGFDHLKNDPRLAEVFHKAMAELNEYEVQGIVATFDFSAFRLVADIGGGYGQTLIAILHKYTNVSGLLFDLPTAKDGALKLLNDAGLNQRCRFVEGDFFDSVPPEADAYILKNVIHDWDDEKSCAIFTRCRQAMRHDARLLLIERVMPEHIEPTAAHRELARSDLAMLLAHGACERTERQFRELLASCGFSTLRVIPASTTMSIIEAAPNP